LKANEGKVVKMGKVSLAGPVFRRFSSVSLPACQKRFTVYEKTTRRVLRRERKKVSK